VRDYAINGTEGVYLPMESPLWRIGSIVGGESHPGISGVKHKKG
jgi:hypothetical protein